MKISNIITTALIASALLIALPGCEKGPAEKVGASIDNAAEKAGDQIEQAGDAVKNAAEGDNK